GPVNGNRSDPVINFQQYQFISHVSLLYPFVSFVWFLRENAITKQINFRFGFALFSSLFILFLLAL
ncbi:MAG TPA: hypothetical protein VLR91_03670, partial [Thermodesulfobacteriota bacterium]|nr:hypothetical protein [Thermodesulfobacteriota bacterium]